MRVAIFIDGSNLFYTQKNLGWWIDLKKFYEHSQQYGDIVEAIYHTGVGVPPEARQEKFLDALTYIGYSIEMTTIKEMIDDDGKTIKKANLDIELVLDMFNQIDNYDLAILCSGDGDFERPIKLLRARGKQFRIYSTQGLVASELRRAAGAHYVDFARLRQELERV